MTRNINLADIYAVKTTALEEQWAKEQQSFSLKHNGSIIDIVPLRIISRLHPTTGDSYAALVAYNKKTRAAEEYDFKGFAFPE